MVIHHSSLRARPVALRQREAHRALAVRGKCQPVTQLGRLPRRVVQPDSQAGLRGNRRLEQLARDLRLDGAPVIAHGQRSAALRGEPTGAPLNWLADVVATTKRDLRAGEQLDGEGGYCVWGKLVPAERSLAEHALPIGLAHNVTLTRDGKAGSIVTWADTAERPDDDAIRFRREMESQFRPFA